MYAVAFDLVVGETEKHHPKGVTQAYTEIGAVLGEHGFRREALPRFVEGVRAMNKQRFASVWDAIEDTPQAAEQMRLRSALMMALKQHLNHTGMSQAQAAQRLGVTQPRVADLMRGKVDLFSLDALVNMATAAGLQVEMRVLEVV